MNVVQQNRRSLVNTPHGRQSLPLLQGMFKTAAKDVQQQIVRLKSPSAVYGPLRVDQLQRDSTPDRVTIGTESAEHTNTKESAMDPSRCLLSKTSGGERDDAICVTSCVHVHQSATWTGELPESLQSREW